jgi:diguanylate cyclase (GGDEF)-like protein
MIANKISNQQQGHCQASSKESADQSTLIYTPPPKTKKYALIIKDHAGVRAYPLNADRTTIGRQPNNDIVLSSRGISRSHATIHIRQNIPWIVDGDINGRASVNGLTINNSPRRSSKLQDGDIVTFCKEVRALLVSVSDLEETDSYKTLEKLVNFCNTPSTLSNTFRQQAGRKSSPSSKLWIDYSGTILAFKESTDAQNLSLYRLFKRYIGKHISLIFFPDDAHKVAELIDRARCLNRPETLICELNLDYKHSFYEVGIFPGKDKQLIINLKHVTEQSSLEKKLLHDVRHDALTQLPNRILFKHTLSRLFQRRESQGSKSNFAVLFIDLDKFKLVNDSFGHLIGDQFLVRISQRLRGSVRPKDLISRLGGDEFAVLLEEIQDLEEALNIARRIQSEISRPLHLNGHELFPSASIGIATSELGYYSVEEILRDADTAMYQAKFSGRSRCVVFNNQMHSKAKDNLKLDGDLRRAVQNQEFRLMYQPIVDLKRQTLIGFEALIRWVHPERGLLSPLEFIPVAEENGLISEIGCWALQAVGKQIYEWNQAFQIDDRFSVNVNLSSKQMADPLLVQNIQKILSEYKFNPRQIKLEITESIVMENSQSAVSIFNQLRQLGIQICIDDFGTGYSSLSYLHRFPIDALKIDQSFVASIDKLDGTTGISIIQCIIGLAHNLGVKVVAEGIETARHLMFLQALQCDYGQGYLFSKPLYVEQATAVLKGSSQQQWHFGKKRM